MPIEQIELSKVASQGRFDIAINGSVDITEAPVLKRSFRFVTGEYILAGTPVVRERMLKFVELGKEVRTHVALEELPDRQPGDHIDTSLYGAHDKAHQRIHELIIDLVLP